MWRKVSDNEYDQFLELAIDFTGDWVRYGQAMRLVVIQWPRTMLNSLTNPSMNRRAFVGHCAAQYEINCPEYITRAAWKELTERQRVEANKQADYAIKLWESGKSSKGLHKNVGGSLLF